MKIKLVSDLHLEFSDINIKNDEGCDVLILSGDIMIAEELYDHAASDFSPYSNGALADLGRKMQRVARFRDFLKRVSFQFPHVVYIAGNHEFYHGKWDRTLKVLHDECAKFPNVYFLEQESKIIDDVTFLCGTLWTDMNKEDPMTMATIRGVMNDYRIIDDSREPVHYRDADGNFHTRTGKFSAMGSVVEHKEMLAFINKTSCFGNKFLCDIQYSMGA